MLFTHGVCDESLPQTNAVIPQTNAGCFLKDFVVHTNVLDDRQVIVAEFRMNPRVRNSTHCTIVLSTRTDNNARSTTDVLMTFYECKLSDFGTRTWYRLKGEEDRVKADNMLNHIVVTHITIHHTH